MKTVIQTVLKSIGVGFVIYLLDQWFGTGFLKEFLKQDLLTIEFALLAINGATLGIVLSKLRDLADRNPGKVDFSKSRREMVLSIREQIALIPISVLLLMVQDSRLIAGIQVSGMVVAVLLVACLAYALFVLYDTTIAVFVVLDS
jgi:hypothetical protein